jgi:predicted transcriptional regulator
MTTAEKPRTKMLQLKESRGGAPQALLDSVREHNTAKAAIRRALADGPLTVPEVAAAAGLSTRDTLWILTAMRKYGTVAEDTQAGSYMRYALTPKEARA